MDKNQNKSFLFLLQFEMSNVQMLETVFPGKILLVTSLHSVSLTPPVVLSSVPALLGALELEVVFRKKTTMLAQTFLANTCMWLICCLVFKQHCCFKCRCLSVFYSLISICFLNLGLSDTYIDVCIYI